MFAALAAAQVAEEQLAPLFDIPRTLNKRLNLHGDEFINPVAPPATVKSFDNDRRGHYDAGIWGTVSALSTPLQIGALELSVFAEVWRWQRLVHGQSHDAQIAERERIVCRFQPHRWMPFFFFGGTIALRVAVSERSGLSRPPTALLEAPFAIMLDSATVFH